MASLLDDMSTEFRLFLRLLLRFSAPSHFADVLFVLGTIRNVVLVSALDLLDDLSSSVPYENKAEMQGWSYQYNKIKMSVRFSYYLYHVHQQFLAVLKIEVPLLHQSKI